MAAAYDVDLRETRERKNSRVKVSLVTYLFKVISISRYQDINNPFFAKHVRNGFIISDSFFFFFFFWGGGGDH